MEDNIYIVKANDNLYDIAKNNNTTIGILKALNNLDNNILQIGQILKLPSAKIEQVLPSDYLIYTVSKDDTLISIANKYNISLEELINFNLKDTTFLNINDQLLIPIKKNSNNNLTYVVKSGDTLYNIAKRFNTSVDVLKELNNLENNMLKIGDFLIIPNSKEFQTYVIRSNDTLNSIANRFNTSVQDIMKLNNLATDDVVVGQIILIS